LFCQEAGDGGNDAALVRAAQQEHLARHGPGPRFDNSGHASCFPWCAGHGSLRFRRAKTGCGAILANHIFGHGDDIFRRDVLAPSHLPMML
jgi:hypothetical protein